MRRPMKIKDLREGDRIYLHDKERSIERVVTKVVPSSLDGWLYVYLSKDALLELLQSEMILHPDNTVWYGGRST